MDNLRNLRDNIQVADQLALLAVVVIVVLVLANVLLAWRLVLPAWQAKGELTAQLAEVQKKLDEAVKAKEATPAELRKQVEAAQAKLDDVASAFFSDSQAQEALNKLDQYGSESQVEIANRQIIPISEEEKKDTYEIGKYQLQVVGSLPDLLNFVSRIEEAVFESFVISDVSITESTEGGEEHTLYMDVALYSSPLSSGATVLPMPGVTVIPQDLAQMEEMLDEAWGSEDWALTIDLIEQILALEPDYADATEKLYAGHVNYGDQLLGEGNPDGAEEQFKKALEIKPDGMEAQAGLQRAEAWAPMPTTAPPTPVTPSPTLTVEEQLAESLHEPWAAKDWETVIGLIGQILAINPGYDDMTEKLYAAHVNYGQQLVAEGRLEEAKVEFTRALDVKSSGGEAMAELQALAVGETPVPAATLTPESQPTTPTPESQYIIHVVGQDYSLHNTLYSIAKEYDTTVEAIMAANGLPDDTIYIGQKLLIPIQ